MAEIIRMLPSLRSAVRLPFGLKQKVWLPYGLIGPALLVTVMIAMYPVLTALRTSLFDMNLLRMAEAKFLGLGNYLALIRDRVFLNAVFRTVRWTVSVVLGQFVVALPVALFLNINFRGRGFIRTAVLIPYIVPSAVLSVIWIYMFDANFGVMNEVLVRLHLIPAYLPWLADVNLSFLILVLTMIWWGMPFMAIMLLAALQALDPAVYDAADIDGAGGWGKFRYITLPQLMPTILIVLLLRTMWMAQHIDVIYLMTDGGPGISNTTMPLYSFMLTSNLFKIGLGSAVALSLSAVLLIGALIYIRNIERSMEYL